MWRVDVGGIWYCTSPCVWYQHTPPYIPPRICKSPPKHIAQNDCALGDTGLLAIQHTLGHQLTALQLNHTHAWSVHGLCALVRGCMQLTRLDAIARCVCVLWWGWGWGALHPCVSIVHINIHHQTNMTYVHIVIASTQHLCFTLDLITAHRCVMLLYKRCSYTAQHYNTLTFPVAAASHMMVRAVCGDSVRLCLFVLVVVHTVWWLCIWSSVSQMYVLVTQQQCITHDMPPHHPHHRHLACGSSIIHHPQQTTTHHCHARMW